MNIGFKLLLAGMAAVSLSGCYTTGMSPREYGSNTYGKMVYGLYESADQDAEVKPVQLPIRLAVGQVGEISPASSVMEFLRGNPALVASAVELPIPGIDKQGYYSQPSGDEKKDETFSKRAATMRAIARDLGADYVFVFGGHMDVTQRNTPAEFLDISIVAAWVVPSQGHKVEAKAGGALVDVETGRVVFTISVEQLQTGWAPTALSEAQQKETAMKLRNKMLSELQLAFVNKLAATP